MQGPMPPDPRGTPIPHQSMSELEQTWTSEPPLRLDAATKMRLNLGGTTHAEAGGTTPSTIAAHHPSLQAPTSLARQSAGPSCQPSFSNRQTSPNTRGKRTLSFGSQITAWHASWAGRRMTNSSSATCHYTWLIWPGRGLSTSLSA